MSADNPAPPGTTPPAPVRVGVSRFVAGSFRFLAAAIPLDAGALIFDVSSRPSYLRMEGARVMPP